MQPQRARRRRRDAQSLLHHHDLCVPSLRSWRSLRFHNKLLVNGQFEEASIA